ncbi:ion channel domain-containing protein [Ditylenchus destructor]|uniref:Ion channel domain-containing protein n=1 Tax=Ditylenchus destructor TaxID=166010 RepID=A0AAD4R2S9_9BILA|nr:ion channel domain-containing protein [Ditylenchus destructor]
MNRISIGNRRSRSKPKLKDEKRYHRLGLFRHQKLESPNVPKRSATLSSHSNPQEHARLLKSQSTSTSLLSNTGIVQNVATNIHPKLHPSRMRIRHALRIASWHVALYCFVIFYLLGGAAVFHYLEGEEETHRHDKQAQYIQQLKEQFFQQISRHSHDKRYLEHALRHFMEKVSASHIPLENYLLLDATQPAKTSPDNLAHKRWTFPSSVLFSFTILTTIGYGNVAPTTTICQVFTMIYGAIGIPIFLITVADVGRFFKTFIMYIVQLIYKKEIKKRGERKLLREIGEVILVAVLFLLFIALGSAVLPLWEEQLTYFDSVYFSYMSLTTIGLGDIVPRRMDFLLPTLLYITIGLWLTTALVEQLADVFRLVHYYGRNVTNVKGITVWLGGHHVSVGSLIQTICRRVGMSDNVVGQINWDRTIDRALKGEPPPLVPIFPWHFADFLEHDPPLIDMSIEDLPYKDNDYDYFYSTKPSKTITCTSPKHIPGLCGRRNLSAPALARIYLISCSFHTT